MKKLGNVTRARSKNEVQERLRELKPLVDLFQNPAMIEWIESVEKDIERLGEAKWCATPADLQILGKLVGITDPTTADLPTLFLCARSVVVFFRTKLKPLKEASAEFNALQKELEGLGDKVRNIR